ncbi:hypothetical protein BSQ97_01780 [Serratia proteamaculans]|nr:hypothetical protein BSQ97_01780 [Serratia proteamaculans]
MATPKGLPGNFRRTGTFEKRLRLAYRFFLYVSIITLMMININIYYEMAVDTNCNLCIKNEIMQCRTPQGEM